MRQINLLNRVVLALALSLWAVRFASAQVAINNTGDDPHASAMLDVTSTDKGILIPRMTAAQRDAISNPANGLLVYVTDDNQFYYYDYDAGRWQPFGKNDGDWKVDGNNMYSLPSGNVGIGTTDPNEKLTVNGIVEIQGNRLKLTGYDGANYFWINDGTEEGAYLGFKKEENNGAYRYSIIGGNDLYQIIFPVGVMGIGTSSPTQKLDVNGNVKMRGTDFMIWNETRGGGNTSTGRALVHQGDGSLESSILVINYENDYPAGTTIQSKLGIGDYYGANAPDESAILDIRSQTNGVLMPRMTANQRDNINNPANGLLVYVTDEGQFYYYDGSEWLPFGRNDGDWRVDGDNLYTIPPGNVGIGTSDTQEKLTVNGNVMIQGVRLKITGYDGANNFWINDGTEEGGFLAFHREDDNGSFIYYLKGGANLSKIVFPSGNFGIGVEDPIVKLVVKGDKALFTSEDDADEIRIENNNNRSEIYFVKNGTDVYSIRHYEDRFDILDRPPAGVDPAFTIIHGTSTRPGYVGIGTLNPDAQLTVFNGTTIGRYTTSGWTHSSDARFKTNIRQISDALEIVKQLRGVRFEWKNAPQEPTQVGFIAQEVKEVLPEVVVGDEERGYGMAYGNITAVLVEAIKAQQKQIENQQKQIQAQQAQIQKLMHMLETLRNN
ncbi:MAG: tail fiber domain-containing protein [Chlorobi bacterium]|nr:tail fiber domain-containing protein [Chlorobiota bacterium]